MAEITDNKDTRISKDLGTYMYNQEQMVMADTVVKGVAYLLQLRCQGPQEE